ncbi:MAG: radical SAM protein [Chloroflexi bacterium]|nr:radical SAM protein [Chloroflexota bacterium]
MSSAAEITPLYSQAGTPRAIDLPPGVPRLGSLYLYIAGACNLACRHCWITPSFLKYGRTQAIEGDGNFISLELLKKAIDQGKELGLYTVKLTGGEPTLHPRFREIVELVYNEGLSIAMETNGTLVDDEMASFLKQGPMNFISVSLDGATRETHEYMRLVDGSYNDALRGIKALVKAGFPVQMICTLHRGNVGEIAPLIELAEGLGCGSVKFNHVQRVGRGERFGEENGLELEEILALHRRIVDEIQPKHQMRIVLDVPFAFYTLEELWRDHKHQCSIRNILGVLGNGQLALCGIGVTIPDLIYGNLATDNLRDVWCYHPGLVKLRELIPNHLEGICKQCLHRPVCRGHCVANTYHVTQQLNAPHQFCKHADEMGLFPASRKIF